MTDAPDNTFVRGPMQEVAVEGPCPYCGEASLVTRSLPLDIPYFGEALQTTILCGACSFRHSDLILTKEAEPVQYELQLADGDLTARVVRSSSGTISIPELGVTIEPGPRAEAFVSTAGGVLQRVRDIVGFAVRTAESGAMRKKAERRLEAVEGAIAGTRTATLVLADPTGNSAILHARATKRRLTKKEMRRLKRAPLEFRVEH